MAKAPQKSKDAKAKAASGGGKKSKKKWSKGKVRDKLANMCLFDKPTFDKVLKEVPNYKVCQRRKNELFNPTNITIINLSLIDNVALSDLIFQHNGSIIHRVTVILNPV